MEKIYFEGVIVDNNGLPLPEVTVVILQGPGEYPDIAAITNEEGKFSFSDLIAGEHLIKFMSETIEMEKWVEIDAETGEYQFVMASD